MLKPDTTLETGVLIRTSIPTDQAFPNIPNDVLGICYTTVEASGTEILLLQLAGQWKDRTFAQAYPVPGLMPT